MHVEVEVLPSSTEKHWGISVSVVLVEDLHIEWLEQRNQGDEEIWKRPEWRSMDGKDRK